jgi:hypothetical protein
MKREMGGRCGSVLAILDPFEPFGSECAMLIFPEKSPRSSAVAAAKVRSVRYSRVIGARTAPIAGRPPQELLTAQKIWGYSPKPECL